VLPLENLSGDPAPGITSPDALTEGIEFAPVARIASLRVISRTSVMPYKVRAVLPAMQRNCG